MRTLSPHITPGFGDLPEPIPIDLPVRSEATRVAICHLGNHCTCRRVIAQFDWCQSPPVSGVRLV